MQSMEIIFRINKMIDEVNIIKREYNLHNSISQLTK